eukprot:CAMPEP_0170169984 /NCGR_PEP_ID=MMETSP0040_2-20121228/2934_1 /TAXON_ID=641309 /ORGANISM="Lotharella oceanica, Strain CCMP622" /LENGTH=247 /DNA_ID=CAMNT_0010409063 /DNA_START=128 /DNA_END=870 /DNA_ORIENTATION=-
MAYAERKIRATTTTKTTDARQPRACVTVPSEAYIVNETSPTFQSLLDRPLCTNDAFCGNGGKCSDYYGRTAGFYTDKKTGKKEKCEWAKETRCDCSEALKSGFAVDKEGKCGRKVDVSACVTGDTLCHSNGICGPSDNANSTIYKCFCKGKVQDKVKCSDKLAGVNSSLGKWGWGYTTLFIFGLIAAAVLLERIWTCGRKTILKMQGREGFRTVPGEDYNEDDDQMRQMGEFGDVEIEEMDGKGRGD